MHFRSVALRLTAPGAPLPTRVTTSIAIISSFTTWKPVRIDISFGNCPQYSCDRNLRQWFSPAAARFIKTEQPCPTEPCEISTLILATSSRENNASSRSFHTSPACSTAELKRRSAMASNSRDPQPNHNETPMMAGPQGAIHAASPPTKQNLKSWWRGFKGQPKPDDKRKSYLRS